MAASSEHADTLRSVDDLELIVDADSHVTESVEDILPYVDERNRAVKELVAAASDPLSEIFSYAQPAPVHPYDQDDGTQLVEGDAGPEAKLAEMQRHDRDPSGFSRF